MRCSGRPARPCGMRSGDCFRGAFDADGQLDRQQAGTGWYSRHKSTGWSSSTTSSSAIWCRRSGGAWRAEQAPICRPWMPSTCWRAAWTSCATGRWPSPRLWSCGCGGSWRGTASREQYARLRIAAQKPDELSTGTTCDCVLENAAATAAGALRWRRGTLFAQRLIEDHQGGKSSMSKARNQGTEGTAAAPAGATATTGWTRPAAERHGGLLRGLQGTFWTQARPSGSAPRRRCAWRRQAGYRPYVRGQALKAGDKVYLCNRGKSVLLAHIGEQSLDRGRADRCRPHRLPPPGPEAQPPV